MRNLWLLAASAFMFCAFVAMAGETGRVPLLNGVYSLEAPANWWVEQEKDGTGVTFSPEKDSPKAIFITAPNVTIGDDYAEYAGVQMGILFKALGGGEITGEEEGETDGYPSIAFAFSIPAGDTTVEGRANVVNFDGAAVIFLVIAPADDIDEFLPIAGEVIDSYQIHPEAIETNAKVIAEVSEKINQGIWDSLKK